MLNTPTSPVFVSADAARAVFRWEDGIRALQAAYGNECDASATPSRTVAREGGAWLRTLPAIPPGCRYYGAKLMGMSATAPMPGPEYVIVLFDRQTSRIAAFIDASRVTAFRTAATSAAAVDRIIGTGSLRLGLLGSGLEASMHARAIAAIRPLTGLSVFSPTESSREGFAATMAAELGIPTHAASSAEEAVEGATVVVCAARSRGELPILFGDWLSEGTTVVSIGSTVREQREIDVSVVERSDLIICDMLEEVLIETGDMIAAREAGIEFDKRCFSLSDLMTGKIEALRANAHFPMFKSVGGGLQDVVIAQLILQKALESGLATPLPISFEVKKRA